MHFDINDHKQVDRPDVDAFIEDLVRVFHRHGMSLGHEDTGGAFIVQDIEAMSGELTNIEWLEQCITDTVKRVPPKRGASWLEPGFIVPPTHVDLVRRVLKAYNVPHREIGDDSTTDAPDALETSNTVLLAGAVTFTDRDTGQVITHVKDIGEPPTLPLLPDENQGTQQPFEYDPVKNLPDPNLPPDQRCIRCNGFGKVSVIDAVDITRGSCGGTRDGDTHHSFVTVSKVVRCEACEGIGKKKR